MPHRVGVKLRNKLELLNNLRKAIYQSHKQAAAAADSTWRTRAAIPFLSFWVSRSFAQASKISEYPWCILKNGMDSE